MADELDRLQASLGFSGRSEVVRAGLKMLSADSKERENISGTIKSVLLLVHDQRAEKMVSQIRHKFDDVIDTQIHTELERGKCLEVFVLNGDALIIRKMYDNCQSGKGMDFVKLIVP